MPAASSVTERSSLIGWDPVVRGEPPAAPGHLPPAGHAARGRLLAELPVLVALAVVIAFVVKSLVAQAFYIPSESMVPQLRVNDRVVVSKLSYKLHDVHRGDILVFDAPPGEDDTVGEEVSLPVRWLRSLFEAVGVRQPSTSEFIKRVVALPGESLDIRDGRVLIDGRPLVEPYLPPGVVTAPGEKTLPFVVPEGQVFVMGDNRGNSHDSRDFGGIEQDTVVGRAVVKVWPVWRSAFL